MEDDSYVPLIDRERSSKERVHENLTEGARDRLGVATVEVSDESIDRSLGFIAKKIGRRSLLDAIGEDTTEKSDAHLLFVNNADTVPVLTYIERLLYYHHINNMKKVLPGDIDQYLRKKTILNSDPADQTKHIISDIRNILVSEGILWRLKLINEGGVATFERLESESFADIDEGVKGLAEGEDWSEPLKGYNDAFSRYLNGDFDDTLVTKLYNSIEEVLKKICVDLEGWTDDREMGHGSYLELLREHEVYGGNGIIAPEINELLDSMEKMVSKVGNDRKQRHAYHDREYCTLLVHQVGAYLYFIINRYEDYAE